LEVILKQIDHWRYGTAVLDEASLAQDGLNTARGETANLEHNCVSPPLPILNALSNTLTSGQIPTQSASPV
jgi:hypothetical protein